MSNPILTIASPTGDLLGAIPPAARDNKNDAQSWQRRCEELIEERDRLKQDLAKTQAERDAYLKTVYHYMCKDYVPPSFTKEEVFAHLDDKPTFEEVIAELEREYAQEK